VLDFVYWVINVIMVHLGHLGISFGYLGISFYVSMLIWYRGMAYQGLCQLQKFTVLLCW
jgi:hypothetical protein